MKFRVSLPSCTPAIPFSSPIKFLAKLDIYIYITRHAMIAAPFPAPIFLPSLYPFLFSPF